MVGPAGLGKAEWALLITVLSPPISWNKVKLALVKPAKFVAQMLQLVPSNSWGPCPALHVMCISTGGAQSVEPGSGWLLLWSHLDSPGPGTREAYEGNN